MHQLARLCVERGEGFVEQNDLGIDHEGTRQVDALLHAAGEFARMTIFETVQADEVDHLLRARQCFAQWDVVQFETVGDVAGDRAPRHQRRALEHHRAVAARAR